MTNFQVEKLTMEYSRQLELANTDGAIILRNLAIVRNFLGRFQKQLDYVPTLYREEWK